MRDSEQYSLALDARDFLIIGQGQLTNSSVWTSVAAFASLSVQHSYFPKFLSYPYYYINTTLRYAYDLYWGGNIESYKLGKMEDAQFIGFLRSQLSSSLSDDELKEGWNAMCSLGKTEHDNLNSLQEFLVRHDNVTAIIPSFANRLQHDHIRSQITSDQINSLIENGRIKFVNSFERNESSLQKLASTAILELNDELGTCNVYSVHNQVTELTQRTHKFDCNPFNPSKVSLSEHLVQADLFFR